MYLLSDLVENDETVKTQRRGRGRLMGNSKDEALMMFVFVKCSVILALGSMLVVTPPAERNEVYSGYTGLLIRFVH